MGIVFADRIRGLQPSAIREILKFTAEPDVISFAAGNPAGEAVPCEFIADAAREILTERPLTALQYSVTEGYWKLRAAVAEFLTREKGIPSEPDDILITAGAQQAMELLTKSLCNEGDVVLCESPAFVGALNAFRSYGARLRGIPVNPDGPDLDALERALQTERNVRFFYTVPTFQNPTGRTASLENRRALYRLAQRYDLLILEDNPYDDTRFDGAPLPTLKSADSDDRVVYVGSFSKILSPGLRVGYVRAPKDLLQKMIVCKQVSDVHTSLLSQHLALRFLQSPAFGEHLTKIREIYRRKARLMEEALRAALPDIPFEPARGGLFLWLELPSPEAAARLCEAALREKVAAVPGSAFTADENEACRGIRLNYSTPGDDDIVRGVELIGKAYRSLQ